VYNDSWGKVVMATTPVNIAETNGSTGRMDRIMTVWHERLRNGRESGENERNRGNATNLVVSLFPHQSRRDNAPELSHS
jgi:hypothetical protein